MTPIPMPCADAFTVRRFTGDGVPLAAWGVGDIGAIAALAVDAQGRVYDAASETKQIVRTCHDPQPLSACRPGAPQPRMSVT